MKKIFAALLGVFMIGSLRAQQQQADSLLPEALVTAYGYKKAEETVAASVSRLNAADFQRYGEASPVLAFQQLPGVRLEERAAGSFRVSIRGSSLRAPFDVRNVKVYWNNLPITEANGTTPLNLFDVNLYRQVGVVRGPAASYYGAGTGGVISIGSLPLYNTGKGRIGAEVSLGSFGYERVAAAYLNADSLKSIHTGITHLQSDGYREQNSFLRQNAYWSSSFKINERRELQTNILLARVKYGIPGGLTLEQFTQNPRQARPGSVEKNASINRNYALLGVGQRYTFNENLSNGSWVFGNASFLDHPFNTDYKRDMGAGIGARSIWEWERTWGENSLNLQFGGELLLGFEVARNYQNISGEPGALNFEDEISTRTALSFLQADLSLSERWELTAGLSFNTYNYDINRLVDASLNRAYALEKDFDPVWAPRIALAWHVTENMQLWGQLSQGFSPPTLDEVRTNEGSLNEALEAETGTNYEIGLRTWFYDGRLVFNSAAYYFDLSQTITSYIRPGSEVVLFRNAGSASQAGLETALQWRILQKKNWLVNTSISAAYQHYRFIDYRKQNDDFSGNALPGVAPFSSALAFNALFRQQLSLHLTHTYTAEVPLNDANSVYGDSFNLLQARLEYSPGWFNHIGINFFVSAQNLLNEKYSLGYDINPFGGRYFQPAASRSFFAGIALRP